jgi:hypothetical protein
MDFQSQLIDDPLSGGAKKKKKKKKKIAKKAEDDDDESINPTSAAYTEEQLTE